MHPVQQLARALRLLLPCILLAASGGSQAGGDDTYQYQPVRYPIAGTLYESMLVHHRTLQDEQPGLLMVPDWNGITPQALAHARRLAGQRHVVLVVDMFGQQQRPRNAQQAAYLASTLKADRAELRRRILAARDAFLHLSPPLSAVRLDTERLAAVGFCFGGTTTLELARLGLALRGAISVHGNLDTPDPERSRFRSPLLVLHGAEDPYVPAAQVDAFQAEVRQAGADWTLVSYGGAVHSFTDPGANMPHRAAYHPVIAERAWSAIDAFLTEQLSRP